MKEEKNAPPRKNDQESMVEEEKNDDIQRVLVEQQSRIINEVNSNIIEAENSGGKNGN